MNAAVSCFSYCASFVAARAHLRQLSPQFPSRRCGVCVACAQLFANIPSVTQQHPDVTAARSIGWDVRAAIRLKFYGNCDKAGGRRVAANRELCCEVATRVVTTLFSPGTIELRGGDNFSKTASRGDDRHRFVYETITAADASVIR